MKKRNERKAGFKRFKELCSLVRIRSVFGLLALLFLFSCVIAVCHIAISLLLQEFVNIATGDSMYTLLQIILATLVVLLVYASALIVGEVVKTRCEVKGESRLRIHIMERVLRIKEKELAGIHSAEIMTRLTEDVRRVVVFLPELFGQTLSELFSAVLALVVMLLINWKLAIIMLVAIPIVTAIISLLSPKMQYYAQRDVQAEGDNRAAMQEIISHRVLIHIYHAEKENVDKVDSLYKRRIRERMHLSVWTGFMSFLNNFMGLSLMFTTMCVGSVFVSRGQVTVGNLIAMVQLTNYVLLPVNGLSSIVKFYSEAQSSTDRIKELLVRNEYTDQAEKTDRNIEKICVRDVSFSYDSNTKVIDKLSCVFTKGINCIVGQSGCGKSTLLKLLMGIYEPDSGSIAGFDIAERQVPISDRIAYVPSEDFLLNDTLAKNVAMGKEPDDTGILYALQRANIAEVADATPEGLNYTITEGGKNLSLGQQQRIAIARAIYVDQPVIIFDEPTANLDVDAIEQYWKTLVALSDEDHICIIVTHDKKLIDRCENVLYLNSGTGE